MYIMGIQSAAELVKKKKNGWEIGFFKFSEYSFEVELNNFYVKKLLHPR